MRFEPTDATPLQQDARIAIFGGSYNPVHNAHIEIGKYVAQRDDIDEVWIMLSPQSPFKKGVQMIPDEVRLQLLTESFQGIPKVKVIDFELHLPKPSYTYKTLEKLKEAYPNYQFSLIFGIDILEHFLKWKDAVKIIEQHKLFAYERPGYQQELPAILAHLEQGYNEMKSPAAPPFTEQLTIIQGPLVDISSTEIWKRIKEKRDISTLVPKPVNEHLSKFHI